MIDEINFSVDVLKMNSDALIYSKIFFLCALFCNTLTLSFFQLKEVEISSMILYEKDYSHLHIEIWIYVEVRKEDIFVNISFKERNFQNNIINCNIFLQNNSSLLFISIKLLEHLISLLNWLRSQSQSFYSRINKMKDKIKQKEITKNLRNNFNQEF